MRHQPLALLLLNIAENLTLGALVRRCANLFQADLECGSLLPLSRREACFARIPSAQQVAPNQSARKLAHSKYVMPADGHPVPALSSRGSKQSGFPLSRE
jgi:hypothetical protein